MKKFFISLFSFVLILAGGIFSANTFSSKALTYVDLEIYDANDLVAYLSADSTYYSESINIKLMDNVDLSEVDLTPISQTNGNFYGTFDGNGYTISNLSFTSVNQYFGLFPKATDATIKNIKISGNIDYTFDPTNIKEIYAGVLVGYAENVVFSNCEFDSPEGNYEIDLPIYSDFNFGLLAGKVKGNPRASSNECRANIKDCVNYYNLNIELNNQKNIYVGSFVGNLQNGYILNTYNHGNIDISNKITDGGSQESINKEYIGGVAGAVSGSGTHIRNSVYSGRIEFLNETNALSVLSGAIIGGALDNAVSKQNINFVYYTQNDLKPSGDEYIVNGDMVKAVANLDKSFLTNIENFDQQSQNTPFDFETIWSLTDSRFHLQNFMTFNFDFKSGLSNIIDKVYFYVDKAQHDSHTARYGEKIDINLNFKNEYIGYYRLVSISLSNLDFDLDKATISEIYTKDGKKVSGYQISVLANATTSGSYDFGIASITYNCVATISDEAKEKGQGGVRIGDKNTSTSAEINIPFVYTSEVEKGKTIVAQGAEGSIYSFDHWKLYYKGEDGEYSDTAVSFDDSQKEKLQVVFGTAPFDREFKLVAYFTDEEAVLVDFGEINSKFIKSVKFGGMMYEGAPIAVAPSLTKILEIVTAKNYKLDTQAFTDAIKVLYGDNSIDTLIAADPEINNDGETLYKFSINMKNIDTTTNKELTLKLETLEDDSNSNFNLLWVWIALGAVVVVAIVIILIVVIRRKKGGKGGKVKEVKVKEKKVDYKDYY